MSNYIAALTTVDPVNHVLTWDTDGYYVVGDAEWQDIVLEARIKYNGGTIGITPRVYADNIYMTALFSNNELDTGEGYAELKAQVAQNVISIGNKSISPLVIGSIYSVRVEIKGSNFKIYLNDTIIFNEEYASMPRGMVGVYSTTGNQCEEIRVDASFADGWTTNVDTIPGGIVSIRELDNENKYLYLKGGTNLNSLSAHQERVVTSGASHTFSFNYKGVGKARVIELDGAGPKTFDYTLIATESWINVNFTDTISADCTKVNVVFLVNNEELMVNEVQLEAKPYATDYIHNENTLEAAIRESSFITYPSENNIDIKNGSVSMWVKPTVTHTNTMNPILLEYGNDEGVIRINYTGGAIKLKYGVDESNSVSIPTSFEKDVWYHIVGMWSQYELTLAVNGAKVVNDDIDYALNVESDIIRFGHGYLNPENVFSGSFDETIIFKNQITDEDIQELYLAEAPIQNKGNMMMRATFNHSIGSFNKSSMEATLAPVYGSPVVVEKEDGTPMRKVSFIDTNTGEYRTYNEERVIYDGVSDYLEVSYDNIDTEGFSVAIRDEEGVTWGDPYTVEGNRIHILLSDEQKDGLYAQPLYVSYQLKDSFTVDFNIGVPDSFRVNVGKHDGQGLKLTYEGNDFTNEKLATMIEMNPLLNPNHEGFLYITNNIEKVSSFRAKATPEDMHANGANESLVIVEPLDPNGNFISHAKIGVTADKGTIIPNYDRGSILSRERAGRYLYKYRAPKLYHKDTRSLEVQDQINIIDRETGLGIQIPIILKTIRVVEHKIASTDTLDSIADTYGTTVKDILIENKMDSIDMDAFMKENIGGTIRVPESYIEGIMTKSPQELSEEKKIVDLVNELIEYMGEPVENIPSGLSSIIDFNGDGLIGIEEFMWIHENKGKSIINSKHEQLLEWIKTNVG